VIPGTYLLAQLKTALVMAKTHEERHQELDATFPPDVVEKWEQMVESWNADSSAPDPYVEPVISELFSLELDPLHQLIHF
jgi:hypothetical protein